MFFRRKKNEDLLKQLNRFIRKIDRAKRELEDIDKEVDRIKVEAENYSNIVKLNKAQMDAMQNAMLDAMKKHEKETARSCAARNWFFCLAGAISGAILGFIIQILFNSI